MKVNDNYHHVKLCIDIGQYLQRTVKQVVNYLYLELLFNIHNNQRVTNFAFIQLRSKDVDKNLCVNNVRNVLHISNSYDCYLYPLKLNKLTKERRL